MQNEYMPGTEKAGFSELGDLELVEMAQAGDLDAEEALIRKYKETVKICISSQEPMRMTWYRKG